ncbi:MAG: hypothetical protein WDN48_16565 [Pseudolabrys sp.]
MRRVLFAVLSAFALVSFGVLAGPAKAGDYYEDGYRHGRSDNVWYSSSCCYRKTVRHERTVHYSRVEEERSYERRGYYDRPYRSSDDYYDRPRRYVDDSYTYAPRRYDSGYVGGYSGAYDSYADSCHTRRVRVADWRGGWVWAVKSSCD